MIELLTVIVAACSIHSGDAANWRIDAAQKSCQKELIECLIKSKSNSGGVELAICIKDRK